MQRANPASIDTIPNSPNQEDHVSMAAHAAYRLLAMAENLAGILGVEYLCAVQGIDLRAPLQTSARLGAACALLRGEVAMMAEDRWLARSEEHTSELQSLMRISYAVFCLNKKNKS